MRAYERLLKYVKVHTTSDPNSGTHPSTLRQFDLAKILVEELKELGLTDAHVDEHCYVYATLPATPGQESAAPLGLIAHMDTADDASGENVRPQIHENYDGEAVTLPATGTVLDPKVFPFLREMKGQTLITTDGSTLLGADDKAGVAEIMTALERIIAENRPHGKLCIGFTPDEEIGEGASLFDVEGFGAAYAYTVDGGELGEKKGVNVPNVSINLPNLTEKDKGDLLFGIEQDIDFVAASFIRNAEAINEIREFLVANGGEHIDIIAKIENAEGVQNIDSIIDAADGVMVARGDLGVEIPACQVPHVQKIIIEKCNHKYKPVITATQMLDSMIRNPRPTRAEVADVANAIYDGTDAIMLSGETAAGKYPIEAVTMMGEIAEQTERYLKFEDYRDGKALEGKLNVSAAVGSAAVSMVEHIKAACIVTPTMSGQTARLISNLRPSVPIYGVTPYEWARRKMQLYWGVRPVTGYEEDSTENIISHAMYMVRREELVERGDMVIFTAGDPATNEVTGEGYMTNMLHIIQAK